MVITGKHWLAGLMLCGASVAAVAQQAATEAPTGFDTPTLVENPGSQSVSNGIAEPAGDSFALDQQVYETTHDVNSGLGPVFNARACSDCHQNPVSGADWAWRPEEGRYIAAHGILEGRQISGIKAGQPRSTRSRSCSLDVSRRC